ncbi:MAG: DUF1311 domain-containing protein [Bdellovibrionaceae bacterium]|nr:DUF1311 domain-containing protein [Pseudobdellovibrionaceae bacterium]
MKQLTTLFFLTILTVGSLAWSQEDKDDEVLDCENALSQLEINICAHSAYQKQNEQLNSVYKALITKVRDNEDKKSASEKVKALRKAQRAWITFRDAECELDTIDSIGGSIYSAEMSSCLSSLTALRIEALKTKSP